MMRPLHLFAGLTLVLVVTTVAVPFGQGRGAAPPAGAAGAPQTPPTGTGFIAGQVVDVPSGKPVPEAIVTLNGRVVAANAARGGASNQVVADGQGRFFFGSLPAGLFTITASKAGYMPPRVAPFSLGEAEKILDARVRLTRTASLSGTLRDTAGDPIVGTDVIVINRTVVNGAQTWQRAGTSRSDDRGIYRVGDLEPGDYVACACGRDPVLFDTALLGVLGDESSQMLMAMGRVITMDGDTVSLDPGIRTYPPTFHANSTTLARATKVTLAAGDEKTGIDMTLDFVQGTRVSGRVVGAPGPVPPQYMRVMRADDDGLPADLSLPQLQMQPDGRFDIVMLPPGQYRIVAVYRDPGAGRAGGRGAGAAPPAPVAVARGAAPSNAPSLWGSELITVGARGLQGVVVTLGRTPVVSGRVQWIGGAPQPTDATLAAATVPIAPAHPQDPIAQMSGVATGRLSPDATFVAAGVVPGRYYIASAPMPGFPMLKSVLIGGMDMTDLPFGVADKDVTDIVITYTDAPPSSVTVTTNAATTTPPFDDAWALVFPAERKYWAEPGVARRRFRDASFSSKGSVTLDGLPAGEYFIAAVTGLDRDWMEATALETLSRKAQRISLGDGEKKALEVRR